MCKPTNEEKRQALAAEKGRPTVAKLAEVYFENRSRRKSIISDKARFRLHIKLFFGNKIPEEIDPLSVDRFRVPLAKKQAARKPEGTLLSTTTIRHTMTQLRAIINFGISRGLTEGTRKKVPVPPMPANTKTEDLTGPQLSALLKALDGKPIRTRRTSCGSSC
ncbi:MAG: hypothetical protein IH611_05025 [Deltaproteobacteria bacterium]|nr:hypothetical protein [Deltaproteobacteria bacterium]